MEPIALLFSEPYSLALNLLESLLTNSCRVKIFTKDIKAWRQKIQQPAENNNPEVVSHKKFSEINKADYLIYLDPDPRDLPQLVARVKQIARISGAKGFLITSPTFLPEGKKLLAPADQIGIIYVGGAPRPEKDSEAEITKKITKWLFSFGPIGEETLLSGVGLATREKRKPSKNYFYALAGVVFVALLPLLLLAFALIGLFFARAVFLKGNLTLPRQILAASGFLAAVSKREASFFGRIPLVGKPYRDLSSFAYVAGNLCRAGQKGTDVLRNTQELTQKILSPGNYAVSAYSEEIYSDLDYIEKTLAFSESEIKSYPKIFNKVGLARVKLLLGQLKKITAVLPQILGEDGKKTYLVLFQNNMELRPGGGFIGSFVLVSVEAGRLIDLTVTDVYSADGQLRGHVEPPLPLKKYLNQANWFLRDSNWDVDFTKNAQKAEWFLDKEIDAAVDGVVGIDLRVAKDLLKATGPVYLDDYQTRVTSENLYEETQAKVEENFFPGSVQKAGFLTALTRGIQAKLTDGSISNLPQLGRLLYQNLTERHLQLFLHNATVGGALANLGWDGAFSPNQIGAVEANFGANKANYFIQRQYFLDVAGNSWRLRIIYQNSANPALGNKGIYKNYFRLVVPNTATGVSAGPAVLEVTEEAGRKENGFYFEVLPGEKKEVNFFWQQPVEKVISWRKQPGTEGDKVVLTVNGRTVYNSTFDKDIVWINTF